MEKLEKLIKRLKRIEATAIESRKEFKRRTDAIKARAKTIKEERRVQNHRVDCNLIFARNFNSLEK